MRLTGNTFLWIGFYIAILIVEWTIFGLLKMGVSWVVVLSAHLTVCLMAFLLFIFQTKRERDARFIVVGIIFIATLGPFGALMMIILLLLYWFYTFCADPLTSLLEAIFPKIVQARGQRIADRIVFGLDNFSDDLGTLPLVDIMRFGGEKQKLSAISKIMRYYTPKFIPALKMAINDPNNSVRVLAGTAVAELENKFHGEYSRLKKRLEKHPDDSEKILELANFCKLYAELSFIDLARNKTMISNALKYYKMYLDKDPENSEVKLDYARILINKEKHDQAEKILIDLFLTRSSYMEESYMLLMELYFKLHKFEEMRAFTQNFYPELCKLIDSVDPFQYEEILFIWGIIKGSDFAKA